ncbi:MAG: quinone oxidoreductase [Ahrensia sp.]|nr:quinone oxidoreductase [Ahrensia sp.]
MHWGWKGAGIIEAVGEGVKHLKVGDRAAYASAPPGSYCESRVMPAAQVCPLPDGISFEQGAAMMLKGLTVEYLFHRTTPIKKGDWVLFHAAAGGVGLLACQWAKSEGINLIGTAGTDEKCALAKANGAAHTINYKTENFVSRVAEITGGKKVSVVMDGVGKDTFEGSLDCIAPFGMMLSFGNASGKVPPFDINILAAKGSLKITRQTLFTHIGDHKRCQKMAKHLFEKVLSGDVKIEINQRFKLDDIAAAHRCARSPRNDGQHGD